MVTISSKNSFVMSISPLEHSRFLEGRVALVTGASRGIGLATAELLAQQGAHVVLNASPSSAERLADLARTFTDRFGVTALALPADAADPAAIRLLYKSIFQSFKRLDVLVNNAGIMQDAVLGMISEDLLHRSLAINVAGPLLHLQEAARLMARHRSGSIINLSSILGRTGHANQTVYCSTKAALIGLTLAAAKELGPKGIRVNAVAPGFIDTDMTRALPEERRAQTIAQIGLGRAGAPADVAQTILFLASDLAGYITGQVLGVDGGMVI